MKTQIFAIETQVLDTGKWSAANQNASLDRPRQLTLEEVQAVAGGPIIQNGEN